jgi:hypothetical protein
MRRHLGRGADREERLRSPKGLERIRRQGTRDDWLTGYYIFDRVEKAEKATRGTSSNPGRHRKSSPNRWATYRFAAARLWAKALESDAKLGDDLQAHHHRLRRPGRSRPARGRPTSGFPMQIEPGLLSERVAGAPRSPLR